MVLHVYKKSTQEGGTSVNVATFRADFAVSLAGGTSVNVATFRADFAVSLAAFTRKRPHGALEP